MITPMKMKTLSGFAILASLTLVPGQLFAHEAQSTVGGATLVRLAPSFLNGLKSLGVSPAPIAPGALISRRGEVSAAFPITTGAFDSAPLAAEIDHAGGLSFTAAHNRASVSSFIIDTNKGKPVLSGLVTCNGNLAGRVTLFDLKPGQAPRIDDGTLKIDNVAVTLTSGAASALSRCLGKQVPPIMVGTARVRAELGPDL